jgi:mono/diheme cytochrome c family protein
VKRVALALVGLVALAAASAAVARRPDLPSAERGRRLAEKFGCFGCHGPGGLRGAKNPGRIDGSVPNFEDDVMMYAKTPEEIHEWIHFGVSRKKSTSRTWQADRDRGALRMPSFKDRMSEREMHDLVAFVLASSGSPPPDDSLAARGLARAKALGCVGCHGPGGRFARPNKGSFKGYVPSWDGGDFPELVRDSTEFRQWVERGVSRRFASDRLASYFLKRAVIEMPGYEKHLERDDVRALWAYVTWLRSPGAAIPEDRDAD